MSGSSLVFYFLSVGACKRVSTPGAGIIWIRMNDFRRDDWPRFVFFRDQLAPRCVASFQSLLVDGRAICRYGRAGFFKFKRNLAALIAT